MLKNTRGMRNLYFFSENQIKTLSLQTNFENVCHSIIKGTVVMTTPERTEATPKTSVHRVVAVVNNHRLQAIGNLIPKAHSANQSRSEEHTSELQSRENLVCRLLL